MSLIRIRISQQSCFASVGRVYDAAVSAETYNMMLPTDPIMLANLAYYKKHENVRGKEITPREVLYRLKLYIFYDNDNSPT